MSRIERLVNLTAALLAAERPLSAEELRARVPGYPDDKQSFRRQFERDKDVLRDLGLPLLTVAVRGDGSDSHTGYRIRADDYYLRDPGLEPDELSALHLAASVVRIDGMGANDASWKLGELPDAAARGEGTGVDDLSAQLPANDGLPVLFAAIAAGEAVGFAYREARRVVRPNRLSFRAGHWYVAGFDYGRADERSFRLDRIQGAIEAVAATDDAAGPDDAGVRPTARPTDAFSRPWELGEGEAVRALVRVDAAQAAWAVAHLGAASLVTTHDGGDVTVALSVRTVDAFRSFVLGFLDHAVVVEPPELRELVVDWLRAMAEEPASVGSR